MGKRIAVRDVQRIHARGLEPAAHLHGLGQCVAEALPEGQGVIEVLRVDLDLQMKIHARLGANRSDDLEQESRTVLQ